MPADIRAFFGGKGQQQVPPKSQKEEKKQGASVRKRRSRQVVEDSDDNETEQNKPVAKRSAVVEKSEYALPSSNHLVTSVHAQLSLPPPSRKAEEPREEVSTSEYFSSSRKRAPTKEKVQSPPSTRQRKNDSPAKNTRSTRAARKTTITSDDEGLGGDDVATAAKAGCDDDYVEASASESDEMEIEPISRKRSARRTTRKVVDTDSEELDLEPDKEKISANRPARSTATARSRRAQLAKGADDMDDFLDSDEEAFAKPLPRGTTTSNRKKNAPDVKIPTRPTSSPPPVPLKRKLGEKTDERGTKTPLKGAAASPAVKRGKVATGKYAAAADPDNAARQHILDSVSTVRPPTPPPQEVKKFNPYAPAPSRDPPSSASAEIPVGAENCLAGLIFVFTGILNTLGREEGQSLVKQYGGKVTSSPSSKTSFVVLGSDAGPKKLQTIEKFKIRTIDENGLFELIRKLPANGGSGKVGEEYAAKKKAEEERIRQMAEEIDRAESEKAAARQKQLADTANPPFKGKPSAVKQAQRAVSRIPSGQPPPSGSVTPGLDDRLWTTKYAPTSLNMICGNKAPVERLQTWLRNWRNNAKYNFKKPGKDGSGIYRAVMIHGPPGIGKTTAAHLVAKLEGYDVVESNSSDTRSKKFVDEGLRGVLDTTSLGGYFSTAGKDVEVTKKNMVLIMDEVDGMSAGDRGGVGALAAIAKKTNIPLILICNERSLPKMRPFDRVVYEIPFRRPSADQIRARLMTICYREGLKVSPQVLDALVEGTRSDIRQLVNMLSTAKLDQQNLDYEGGKNMSKAWEKHIILKPWDIVGKILSSQTFAPSNNTSLNDKIELYFNDHEFSYLMLQENYIKTNPTIANRYSGPERKMKILELFDNAAESISDGDLVDRQIHGSQQQWSLMPTHAAFSFVRPASYVYGNMTERPTFTSWLGNNSKQGKMAREVKEIQGHMRLRSSADRHEVRQQYLPTLWTMLVDCLQKGGKESVREVIDLMD
ncbi:hypothetical protein KEM54_001419, partial [Ascosphaera aggregata]